MGNNRQQLRDSLAKDIQGKIDLTKKVLLQLHESIENVEKSATDTKLEVESAADHLSRQLIERKLELCGQIDDICMAQVNALRGKVENACVRLGSLQNLLSNLEQVDGSQLGNVHVPQAPSTPSVPPVVNVSLNTRPLTESIGQWGQVSSKQDVVTSLNETISSVLDKYFLRPEMKRSGSVSSKEQGSSFTPKKCVADQLSSSSLPCRKGSPSTDPKDWQIDQWLSSVKIRNSPSSSSTIGDDFEMISEVDDNVTANKPENVQATCQVLQSQNISSGLQPEDKHDCDEGSQEGDSIVCVDYQEQVCMDDGDDEDEVSKWLKPKKRFEPRESVQVCPPPQEDIIPRRILNDNVENLAPVKNKKLDFPCLQADPNSWTVPRKRKNTPLTRNFRTELCLGQTEIIPPQYALPYPFWLKK